MPEDSGNDAGRVLLWVSLGVLVVLLLFMPFGWFFGGGWWDWLGGLLWMLLLFPVLLVVLIVVLIVAIANGSRRQHVTVNTTGPPFQPVVAASPGKALDILEQRYAKGELTRAEYLRMRDDLAGKR